MSEIRKFSYGDQVVEAKHIDTVDDVIELREAEDWHEGAVAVLTFKSADPVAWVGENPKSFYGRRVALGNVIVKGPAGDFAVFDGTVFASGFEAVAA